MEEELKGYSYYMLRQEKMKNSKPINFLYDRYNGLISKEEIILVYAYVNSYFSKRMIKRLIVPELDKEYNKRRFEKGTYRLIHTGGRQV